MPVQWCRGTEISLIGLRFEGRIFCGVIWSKNSGGSRGRGNAMGKYPCSDLGNIQVQRH